MVNKQFNHRAAVIAGVTGGVISGLVKLGWENILPPRTPQRDQTNPHNNYCNKLGFPPALRMQRIHILVMIYQVSAMSCISDSQRPLLWPIVYGLASTPGQKVAAARCMG